MKHLLFVHAFMSCDTTSAIYNRGPTTGFNKLQNDQNLQRCGEIFNNPNAMQDHVVAAGQQFIVQLYEGKRGEGLDKTRYKKYVQTVGGKPPNYFMHIASLPPTSAVARQHNLRIYRRTGSSNRVFYIPVSSNLPPAPKKLLHLIRCGCKGDCSRNCECQRSGLNCTTMCSGCAGEFCFNRNIPDSDDKDASETKQDHIEPKLSSDVLPQAKDLVKHRRM